MSAHKPGLLVKKANGLWAIGTDELAAGDAIQIGIRRNIGTAWLHGRIEQGAQGYYFLWLDVNGGPGQARDLHEGMPARRM